MGRVRRGGFESGVRGRLRSMLEGNNGALVEAFLFLRPYCIFGQWN